MEGMGYVLSRGQTNPLPQVAAWRPDLDMNLYSTKGRELSLQVGTWTGTLMFW